MKNEIEKLQESIKFYQDLIDDHPNDNFLIYGWSRKIEDLGKEVKEISTLCKRCKGKKKLPLFDEFDGKLKGSFKCPKCNGGVEPVTWTDSY